MSYTETCTFNLGSGFAAITPRARVVSSAGTVIVAPADAAAASGWVAGITPGTFSWTYAFPDDFRGFVEVVSAAATTVGLLAVAVSPPPAPAAGAGVGDGDTDVDHNTGGTDNLRAVASGVGIDNVEVTAFLASDFDAGVYTVRGRTVTRSDGRWAAPLRLNAGLTYVIRFQKVGVFGPNTVRRTI